MVAHDARLRMRGDDGAAEPLDQIREIFRRPRVGGGDLFRIAGRACRSWQRDLGVRHELLVVLERVVVARSGRRVRDRTLARDDAGVRGERIRREVILAVARVGRRIARIAVTNQRAGEDVGAGRRDVAEPRGPRAVVGDSAERGELCRAVRDVTVADHRGGFMDDRLVEPRASASRLIDDVGRDAVAHEIRRPALAAIGRGLEACRRVRRPVHHDDRRRVRFLVGRDLELHVHLADRDLIRIERLIRPGHGRVRRDFRHAADEEAALVLDHQRLLQKLSILVLLGVECADGGARGAGNHERRKPMPHLNRPVLDRPEIPGTA